MTQLLRGRRFLAAGVAAGIGLVGASFVRPPTLAQSQPATAESLSARISRLEALTQHSQPEEPTARLIDGRAIAADIRKEIKTQTELLKREHGVTPGLAVVMVGKRTDSATCGSCPTPLSPWPRAPTRPLPTAGTCV